MSQPSPNPTLKLRYFNMRGLAEPIRFLFAYAGQAYEDIRVPNEDWSAVKPTTPMGQMPLLEVDGVVVHQSGAILRYLAKSFKLAGENDWEALLIETIADTITDFRIKLSAPWYESDTDLKAKKKAAIEAEVAPFYLEKFEAIARENNGHLALSKLTWTDLYFTAMQELFPFLVQQITSSENYPNLKKVVDNVYAVESIKAWIAKRPQTEH